MKKLMVAAFAVAFAAVAQAAYVNWDSGSFSTLDDCTAIWGSTGTGSDWSTGCITMYVWEFAAADWTGRYETTANIWADFGTTLTAANALEGGVMTADATSGMINVDGANTFEDKDPVYAAVLFLHDETGGFTKDSADFYMANYGKAGASNLGGYDADLGNTVGGVSSLQTGSGDTVWMSTAAAPEPTSGLLLLLGVAGLALKRKRA